MTHSKAYRDGYAAYKRNMPRHGNPAHEFGFDAIEWDLGWEAAKIDAVCGEGVSECLHL